MLRKIGAQQNTSAAVGGVRSRALIGYRKGGGKSSADGLQMRLRAARSPPRKSRRPSIRDASFSEAILALFGDKVELEYSQKFTIFKITKRKVKVCYRSGRQNVALKTFVLI